MLDKATTGNWQHKVKWSEVTRLHVSRLQQALVPRLRNKALHLNRVSSHPKGRRIILECPALSGCLRGERQTCNIRIGCLCCCQCLQCCPSMERFEEKLAARAMYPEQHYTQLVDKDDHSRYSQAIQYDLTRLYACMLMFGMGESAKILVASCCS